MRRAAAAGLLILLAVLPLVAADPPAARGLPDGGIAVSLPVDLLSRREVARQLTSGLTTTFAIRATSGSRRGGARIEVRFEPWDEVYFVTTRGIDLKAQTVKVKSAELLREWWRRTSIRTLSDGAGVTTLAVSVDILPFSIEEQRETQRWLTRSLGEAHQEQSLDPGEVSGSGGASVLDVLIGTSIQRRPILRYRWNVPVTR